MLKEANSAIAKALQSENISESNVNRLEKWFDKYECAIISAYRNRIENETEHTWIQRDENGNKVGENRDLTYAENQIRHKKLKDALLGMKYGITAQRGQFRENGKESTGEKSFVVVNLNDDPNFKENMIKLSEYFNQDSFIYKPKNTENAVYIGTNNASDPPWTPGYRKEENCGKFLKKTGADFFSKIRGNEYVFESSKNHRDTFEHLVCEESFKSASFQRKQGISGRYNDFLSESIAKSLFEKEDELSKIKNLLKNYIRKNGEPVNFIMKESKIGRLYKHVEDPDKVFAIISSSRHENSAEEKVERYEELKDSARKLGYGYIEFIGGYKETSEDGNSVEVVEPSILIPNIKKEEAIELGKKFDQDSILYKDGKTMVYIVTSGNNVGEILDRFNCGKGKVNFKLNGVMNHYFSRLRKGNHRNSNISFVLSERVYNGEIFRKAFSGGKSSPTWEDVDLNGKQMTESSINRIKNWLEKKECACISACRNRLENITDGTCIDKEEGHKFSKEENQGRNKNLKAWLLKLGYGVTAQDGVYVEETSGKKSDGKEVSFFVVNLNDDKDFFDNIFKLSEYFNQDSFLYKKPDESEAFLVGTNNAEFPGYGKKVSVGTFKPLADEGFLSKIGSKSYQFRKENSEGVEESISDALGLQTFKKLQMNTRSLINESFKKYPFKKR